MGSFSNNRMPGFLKVAFATLLLGCLLIVMMGEFIAIKIVQWDIRKDMAATIAHGVGEDQLVLIKISNHDQPTDFVWVEPHEFRYKGNSYDIVREEIRGDSTYFYCVFDERETALYAEIDKKIVTEMANDPERQQQQKELLQKIPKFYFFHADPFLRGFNFYSKLPMTRLLALSDAITIPPTPPPDGA